MKKFLMALATAALLASCGDAKPEAPKKEAAVAGVAGDKTVTAKIDGETEVGCGMCVYHMEGVKQCELSVKHEGKIYKIVGKGHTTYKSARKELKQLQEKQCQKS